MQANRERESELCRQNQNDCVGSRAVLKQSALHCCDSAIAAALVLSFLDFSVFVRQP
jgi:hypothetical protein